MKKHAVLFWVIILYFWLFIFAQMSIAETFQWNYNRFHFDKITGFRLYMGTTETNLPTLVADIPKSAVSVVSELPILVKESFDASPGTKYATSGGGFLGMGRVDQKHENFGKWRRFHGDFGCRRRRRKRL